MNTQVDDCIEAHQALGTDLAYFVSPGLALPEQEQVRSIVSMKLLLVHTTSRTQKLKDQPWNIGQFLE